VGRYSFNFLIRNQQTLDLLEDLKQLLCDYRLIDVHNKVCNEAIDQAKLLLANVLKPIKKRLIVLLVLNSE
jgi:hypothetical protein